MPSIPKMEQISCSTLITPFGEFQMLGYVNLDSELTVIVLIKGNVSDFPLVRIHSKCATSEVFGSLLCDCAGQMHYAMERIQDAGSGVIIYLPNQEARGNGLKAKLQIYQVMEEEQLTSSQACDRLGYLSDVRSYEEAAGVLRNLNIQRLRLLTNNPSKVEALRQLGFSIQREPHFVPPNQYNLRYLQDKEDYYGHDLGLKNYGGKADG